MGARGQGIDLLMFSGYLVGGAFEQVSYTLVSVYENNTLQDN